MDSTSSSDSGLTAVASGPPGPDRLRDGPPPFTTPPPATGVPAPGVLHWRVLGLMAAAAAAFGVLALVAGAATGRLDVAAPIALGGSLAILILYGVAAVHTGRTLRRRWVAAELDAQASHNYLQKLIDNTAAVIYMKRIDNGRYLLVNREWERLFKVNREQVINLNDHGVFPQELADQLRANDLWAARKQRTVQFEETAQTDQGPRTYVSVKFPVLDVAGEPYAICGISTDITEWKHAEAQARQSAAELETRVRQRTAELEASNRELDAFAYSVSHDLRAPLRSLHGFSQALLDDYPDQLDRTGRDYLHRIQANVARMGHMIDDLLNLSRATRLELARRDVDLSVLAREIAVELAAAEPDREVALSVQDGLHAHADPQLLRLLLQNLMANAWKFTGRTPQPQVQLIRCERDGQALFVVRDNGAGFDMRYADKLFTAFQRLHPAADFEGTGIGLAIVARIVHRHGGRIFAEAAPDQGASFYFCLESRMTHQPDHNPTPHMAGVG